MLGILRVGYDLGDVPLNEQVNSKKYPQYFQISGWLASHNIHFQAHLCMDRIMIRWRYKMTNKGKQQEPQRGKPVYFLISLDSTLEQCEAIAAAFRQYAREHPDAQNPRNARRLAGSLNTCSQEPGHEENNNENTSQ